MTKHVLTTGALIGALFAPELALVWVIGGMCGSYLTALDKYGI